jgi:hypothetical protein
MPRLKDFTTPIRISLGATGYGPAVLTKGQPVTGSEAPASRVLNRFGEMEGTPLTGATGGFPTQCHSFFQNTGKVAELVGQTPWSARVPLNPLFARRIKCLPQTKSRPGGRLRTRASAPQFVQVSGLGKNEWHWVSNPPRMGRRPTEVHENPLDRRRAVGTTGSGAGARVFPVRGGGFSTLPHEARHLSIAVCACTSGRRDRL